MEESAAPTELNMMFTNVENNGAPWQFPAVDRLNWKDELNMEINQLKVPTMAEMMAKGELRMFCFGLVVSEALMIVLKKLPRLLLKF